MFVVPLSSKGLLRSAPLQRRAGSSGAECLSASSEIVGARFQSH
jgi:hypothetical protein